MMLVPDHHLMKNIWLSGSSRIAVGFGAHNNHQSLYYVAGKIFHLPKSREWQFLSLEGHWFFLNISGQS